MPLTDPAREFADTLAKMTHPRKEKGDAVLAELFGVKAWSTEFLEILTALSRRSDEIISIIDALDLDDDHRQELIGHVQHMRHAFSPSGLQAVWQTASENFLGAQHVGPIKALSSAIRPRFSYPKLDASEVAELKAVVDELLGWLREHQLHEQDFIRQALIDGLEQFTGRLDRLSWLGWGYTLESLREVIHAYLALQRGFPDASASPDAEVMLKKTMTALRTLLDKAELLKRTVTTADWALKALGAMALALHAPQVIAGLLTYSPLS